MKLIRTNGKYFHAVVTSNREKPKEDYCLVFIQLPNLFSNDPLLSLNLF